MVDFEEKIKRYSRVAWINDSTFQTRDRDHSPPPSLKRQRLISSSANLSPEQPVEFSSQAPDDTPEESNPENDVPQDFLFDFTNNADNLSPSKPETSPLSSLCTTPKISGLLESSDLTAIYDKPVTRSHRTPNTELFSPLSSANSPEVPEPKTYKQTVSEQNPYHDDWKAAMQEEIDSLISNDTWILMQLPPGRTAIDGKWVYKVKRGSQEEILQYKARWVVRGFQQRESIDYAD